MSGADTMDIYRMLISDRRISPIFRAGLALATRHPMKIYSGRRDHNGTAVVRVTKNGDARALPLRLDLDRHSPTGFEWGYAGSGPSQLALAILADALGNNEVALRLHQAFKSQIIAALPQNESWLLTEQQVRDAATEIIRNDGG